MKLKFLVIISAIFVASCSTSPPRRLEPIEKDLQTDGQTTMLFHSTLYYPVEISIKFDGYIIGIEKSPSGIISKENDIIFSDMQEAGLTKKQAEDKIIDKKLIFISHIIKNNEQQGGIDNCAVYNAYENKNHPEVKQLIKNCSDEEANNNYAINDLYNASWNALDRLEYSINDRLKKYNYSDIIIITMGWNTVQEEAARNFNSIVSNLKRSSGENFNPLIIGVTWPSQWESDWLSPLYKLFSFPVKSADADELGITWLGVLLHKTIKNINKDIPVTVIGHSFGSRASSVASCIGPAINQTGEKIKLNKIKNLINIQGAFLSKRFFGSMENGIYYPGNCANVSNITLTSSIHDNAMGNAFWGIYAGDKRSYEKMCKKESGINCIKSNAEGDIHYLIKQKSSNITYVDADDIIIENAYLSGGGAHSDIYRKEHGTLIKNLMNLQSTNQ